LKAHGGKVLNQTTELSLRQKNPKDLKLALEQENKELHRFQEDPNVGTRNRIDTFSFGGIVFVLQLAFLFIYGFYGSYPDDNAATSAAHVKLYPYFRDVSIMIFFGFGFLMTFIRKNGYAAIGFTLLISALVTEYAVIVRGILFNIQLASTTNNGWSKFELGIDALLDGLFCSGAVMISYGAILGKVSPSHLVIMAIIEPLFYFANVVCLRVLGAVDIGGGMTIHTYGAYFGLVVCRFLTNRDSKESVDIEASYVGDIFSLAGTLFLWILWPSFNAATAATDRQATLALINTFFSICSSVLGTFIASRIVSHSWKFDIVHIQNSTLAGGVVMGVAANLNLTVAGACACGFIAGVVSVIGYTYVNGFLLAIGIQDICGVHNLHGMPGLLSGLVGVFATINYNDSYAEPKLANGHSQPGYQMAMIIITLGWAVAGGVISGIIMSVYGMWRKLNFINYFNDNAWYNVASDYAINDVKKHQ